MTAIARQHRQDARPPRKFVDFNAVPPSQYAIHDRLLNWGQWSYGSSGRDNDASPMFRLHRSDQWTEREYGSATDMPINKIDAAAIDIGVKKLPLKHRAAVQWCYLEGYNPMHRARLLAVSLQGLADLIRDGRQMLINRGV